MPFDLKHAPVTRDPTLIHLDDSKDPAIAVFSDKSTLEMPAGLKYVPDNKLPDRLQGVDPATINVLEHPDVKVRLLIQRPPVKDAFGREVARPNVWLILHCQKSYVEAVIKKLVSEG